MFSPTHSTHPTLILHLHHNTAQSIDAPGLPVCLILRIYRHRVGEGGRMAINPMMVSYIVAITCGRKDHCSSIITKTDRLLAGNASHQSCIILHPMATLPICVDDTKHSLPRETAPIPRKNRYACLPWSPDVFLT